MARASWRLASHGASSIASGGWRWQRRPPHLMDWPYQLFVCAVDVALLAQLYRRRHSFRVYWLLLAFGVALVGALLLSANMFHAMRLAAWLMFAHAPALGLITAAWLWRPRRKLSLGLAVLSMSSLAIAVDAFFVEPHALETNHVRIHDSGAARPFRIGIIADLQTDEVGAYERKAFEQLLAEKPDLILLPGDYIQLAGPELQVQRRALQALLTELQLKAPMGVFAVGGNVEAADWTSIFAGTGVQALERTASIAVNEWLTVTGLSLEDSFNRNLLLPDRPGLHVVFGHAPDFALGNIPAELLVAGHTHGGQVQLPLVGPLVTLSQVPRSWAAGHTQLAGGRHLFVSRGVGMERGYAPRLRFLCKPELVIIDVDPD